MWIPAPSLVTACSALLWFSNSVTCTVRYESKHHTVHTYSLAAFFLLDCRANKSLSGSDEAVKRSSLVLEFEASGLHQNEFCRNHGLALSPLSVNSTSGEPTQDVLVVLNLEKASEEEPEDWNMECCICDRPKG